uniref:VWFA domain-containing protein n=1 Tax=Plectus sambesii TaxID=2011161 RepID=A0A914WUG9_9BILA
MSKATKSIHKRYSKLCTLEFFSIKSCCQPNSTGSKVWNVFCYILFPIWMVPFLIFLPVFCIREIIIRRNAAAHSAHGAHSAGASTSPAAAATAAKASAVIIKVAIVAVAAAGVTSAVVAGVVIIATRSSSPDLSCQTLDIMFIIKASRYYYSYDDTNDGLNYTKPFIMSVVDTYNIFPGSRFAWIVVDETSIWVQTPLMNAADFKMKVSNYNYDENENYSDLEIDYDGDEVVARQIANDLRCKLNVKLIGMGIDLDPDDANNLQGLVSDEQKSCVQPYYHDIKDYDSITAVGLLEIQKDVNCAPPPASCDLKQRKLDLVFMLDASMSTSSFQSVKTFVETMLLGYNINQNSTQFGLITIAATAQPQFMLIASQNGGVPALVDPVPYDGSNGQNMTGALTLLTSTFAQPSNGYRNDAQHLVIYITSNAQFTDGDPVQQADRIRQSGSWGIATLAYGTLSGDSNNLIQLSGKNNSCFYPIVNPSDLNTNGLNFLQSVTCSDGLLCSN